MSSEFVSKDWKENCLDHSYAFLENEKISHKRVIVLSVKPVADSNKQYSIPTTEGVKKELLFMDNISNHLAPIKVSEL
jgi:hypothetical protein